MNQMETWNKQNGDCDSVKKKTHAIFRNIK